MDRNQMVTRSITQVPPDLNEKNECVKCSRSVMSSRSVKNPAWELNREQPFYLDYTTVNGVKPSMGFLSNGLCDDCHRVKLNDLADDEVPGGKIRFLWMTSSKMHVIVDGVYMDIPVQEVALAVMNHTWKVRRSAKKKQPTRVLQSTSID